MKQYKNGKLVVTAQELDALVKEAVSKALAQQPKAAKESKSGKAGVSTKPKSKKAGMDWASLPERKTLNRNQVAHRAICKALGKGYSRADYDALWNSWKEFRDQ